MNITLSADVLRRQTPDGIRKEILARLVALNVLRSIILEASAMAGVNPRRISFVHTVRAILSFSPALARAPVLLVLQIHYAMLTEIADHIVPLRTGRREPRAIHRDRKRYPALKVTRAQWRKHNAA